MKHYYKVTLRTRDIFNFTTSTVFKQFDADPYLLGAHISKEGQIVDVRVSCTQNEKLIIGVALKDYILRMVPVTETGRDLSFKERLKRLWT